VLVRHILDGGGTTTAPTNVAPRLAIEAPVQESEYREEGVAADPAKGLGGHGEPKAVDQNPSWAGVAPHHLVRDDRARVTRHAQAMSRVSCAVVDVAMPPGPAEDGKKVHSESDLSRPRAIDADVVELRKPFAERSFEGASRLGVVRARRAVSES